MTEPVRPAPDAPREDDPYGVMPWVSFSFIRAQGPGGQNVNKVSSAVQLRFDATASPLPAPMKARLLSLAGQRATQQGDIVIKAQTARTQEQNKAEALQRLNALLQQAAHVPRVRRATKPTFGSQQRRLQGKAVRSGIKAGRGKVQAD